MTVKRHVLFTLLSSLYFVNYNAKFILVKNISNFNCLFSCKKNAFFMNINEWRAKPTSMCTSAGNQVVVIVCLITNENGLIAIRRKFGINFSDFVFLVHCIGFFFLCMLCERLVDIFMFSNISYEYICV